ncbi:globin [Spongiibacter sp.]|uniref:globin domain-containing protein n=1 Tax=Spongiibacter sp. TaxID=2024860 RepID=UPI003561F9E8
MQTPYEILGESGISDVVQAFYQLMDSRPEYAEIRAMHGDDLSAVSAQLSLYLTSWMGGPPVYVERNGSMCITAAHRGLGIAPRHSQQWLDCFAEALAQRSDADRVTAMLLPALRRITDMLQQPAA